MNQIFNPAALIEEGLDSRSVTAPEVAPACGRAGRVEYDDGNPATIAPRHNGSGPSAALSCGSDGGTGCDLSARFRRPLTTHNRTARVDYDDGDPGTIVPDGAGVP